MYGSKRNGKGEDRMKTYDKLTKAEKEKLTLFLQYLTMFNIKLWAVFATGCIFIAIGIPLVLIFTIPVITLTGFFMLLYGMMFVFTGLASFGVAKKHLFLIFGYKDSFIDVFDISKADLKKVKINKEVKWIWKKEA
jgi:uncharacterized membrane protein